MKPPPSHARDIVEHAGLPRRRQGGRVKLDIRANSPGAYRSRPATPRARPGSVERADLIYTNSKSFAVNWAGLTFCGVSEV